MNEQIEIKWRDRRIYLPLQQVQHIVNGISTDLTNSELCSMLDLFVADNDRKDNQAERETKEMIERHNLDIERKSDD